MATEATVAAAMAAVVTVAVIEVGSVFLEDV